MDDSDYQMSRIADFCDIPASNYRGIWHELRKIRLMHTARDVEEFIK